MGIKITEVLLDIFCCCCESWRRKLKQSESTTAIVSSPSETTDLNHKADNGTSSVAFWVTKSPSTTTEIRRVQPSGDSYYSDDSSSSKDELSHSAEDLRPQSSLMVEKDLRPRSNSARHLSRNRSRSPNKHPDRRVSSSKDTSPQRTPLASPSKSPQHAKLAPKRSSEGGKYALDISQIQPELYITEAVQTKYITPSSTSKSPKNRKDELMEECFGTMTFSVKNDQSRLIVHLKEITDLPIKGGQTAQSEMTYDVVVQACLLPEEKPLLKSKVIKDTLNPVFDETLVVPIDRSKNLEHVALRMSVYCSENCLRHETIGHVVVPLSDCSAIGTENNMMMRIHKKSQVTGDLGAILVSLAYLPSLERLSVVIIRAKDLKGEKGTTTEALETYVKVTLQCQGEKVKTRRTTAVRGTPSPVYTESLAFVVPMPLVDQTCLIIQVAQKTHFKRDPILGQLVLGPFIYTTGNSLSHWGKMLSSREATKQWHILYM